MTALHELHQGHFGGFPGKNEATISQNIENCMALRYHWGNTFDREFRA